MLTRSSVLFTQNKRAFSLTLFLFSLRHDFKYVQIPYIWLQICLPASDNNSQCQQHDVSQSTIVV